MESEYSSQVPTSLNSQTVVAQSRAATTQSRAQPQYSSTPPIRTSSRRQGAPPKLSVGVMTAEIPRNVAVVSSISGGIGASVLAALIAEECASRDVECVLVDTDFDAGGLDILLGIESEHGVRFETLDAPLGRIDGESLNRELPQWDGVRVLSFDGWNSSAPQWWQVRTAVRALSEVNHVVVVDAGRGLSIDHVDDFSRGVHVVVVELSVLGLARAWARLQSFDGGVDVVLVGVNPRGGLRRQGVVDVAEAEDYLGESMEFLIEEDRRLQDDVLSGLGVRSSSRKNRQTVAQLVDRIESTLRERDVWVTDKDRGGHD